MKNLNDPEIAGGAENGNYTIITIICGAGKHSEAGRVGRLKSEIWSFVQSSQIESQI